MQNRRQMNRVFKEWIKYENQRFHDIALETGENENCTYKNCDLQRTIFKNTNREGVDFRTSFNYSIDPDANRIKKAKFSLLGVAGLPDKYDIEIEK